MSTPPSDHPTWGEGVEALRSLKGWSQTELAERCGSTQSSISRIEKGSRRISDALRVRIARALETDPHLLFPYEGSNGGNGNGHAA